MTCSLFVTFSGKVKVGCSNEQRGVIVCLGAGIMSLTVCPDYLVSGVVFQGILPFAAVEWLGVAVILAGVCLAQVPALGGARSQRPTV